MNKMKKALLMTLCAGCLVVTTVFGTLAYLTDSDQNVNTFTVGKVDIELNETDVDTSGKPIGNNNRDKANEYHLIPGQTYTKDPTVTVKADSESSYIYMIVTVENIDQLKAALPKTIVDENDNSVYYEDNVFLLQKLCDWKANSPWQYKGYRDYTEAGTGIQKGEYRFVYKKTVAGEASEGVILPALFTTITVPGEHITSETIKYLSSEKVTDEETNITTGGVKICVDAYAVQAAGFADYNKAWDAAAFEGYDADEKYNILGTP